MHGAGSGGDGKWKHLEFSFPSFYFHSELFRPFISFSSIFHDGCAVPNAEFRLVEMKRTEDDAP